MGEEQPWEKKTFSTRSLRPCNEGGMGGLPIYVRKGSLPRRVRKKRTMAAVSNRGRRENGFFKSCRGGKPIWDAAAQGKDLMTQKEKKRESAITEGPEKKKNAGQKEVRGGGERLCISRFDLL